MRAARQGAEKADHRHGPLRAGPSGHAAAPAISDMNSRLLIAAPKALRQGIYTNLDSHAVVAEAPAAWVPADVSVGSIAAEPVKPDGTVCPLLIR